MTAFDVSAGISPRQSLDSWSEFVAALEAEGVRRIWVIDSQLAMKDAYVGLTVAAMGTRRIGLGTGVTNAVTRHPTVTANAIAAIGEISGGRAFLGLGAGDSALYGVGLKPQKVAEVEEAINFFRAVLGGRQGELGGRQYRLPHVAATVPIYLAVSQERMCDLAGRLADGAIVMGPAQPDMVRRQVGWIENGLRTANRSRADFEVAFVATMSAAGTLAAALDEVRSWASTQSRLLAHFKELPESLRPFDDEIRHSADSYDYAEHLSTRARHSAAISDDLTRALAIVGTPDECAERLRALRATGIDAFILPLAGRDRVDRWRKIRSQVLDQIML
ncbi:MAG TPA: LLM class flavin-dependent oxidoreductase [Methylomirabilota bacterium]|nr:LLM class flavin-dependent oxidoreductase [Methylomirabilota bacterium]